MYYLAKSIVTDTSAADPFLAVFALFCLLGIVGGVVYCTSLLAGAVRWVANHLPNARLSERARIAADRARLNAEVRATEPVPADRDVAL